MPYNNQAIPPTPEPLGAATLPCKFRILLDYDLSTSPQILTMTSGSREENTRSG